MNSTQTHTTFLLHIAQSVPALTILINTLPYSLPTTLNKLIPFNNTLILFTLPFVQEHYARSKPVHRYYSHIKTYFHVPLAILTQPCHLSLNTPVEIQPDLEPYRIKYLSLPPGLSPSMLCQTLPTLASTDSQLHLYSLPFNLRPSVPSQNTLPTCSQLQHHLAIYDHSHP